MILLCYKTPDGPHVAIKAGDCFRQAGDVQLRELLGGREVPGLGEELDEARLSLAPCVPQPGKIICVGLNYRRHALESGQPVPKIPILFSKYNNSLAGSGQEVPLPSTAVRFDFEAELGVVIGKRAHAVRAADALDHVWGYFCANDLSARDLQHRTSQWMLGKTLDHFFPIGPYLVSADEAGDPAALRIRSFVNGEKRQDASTGDMVFGVAELVSYISQYVTLETGDLISTGTPSGVIEGMNVDPKPWLRPGDEVTVEIDGLGRLVSRLVAAGGDS